MKQSTNICVPASRGQKIFGVIALAGVFVCGLMIGISMHNGSDTAKPSLKEMGMNESQCNQISKHIIDTAQGINCSFDKCTEKLRELNDVYTKNCAGRVVRAEQAKPEPKAKVEVEDTANKETCEVIEDIMLSWIGPETVSDRDMHRSNINVYQKLVTHGCPENNEKYQKLIQRENEILAALTGGITTEDIKTCAEIENLLTRDMPDADNYFYNRMTRAQRYANLSERGCQENKQKYVDLTMRELEVARALQDDKLGNNDVQEFYEIYNRIGMYSEAQKFRNKFPHDFPEASEMY